jgi:hypothetical protein
MPPRQIPFSSVKSTTLTHFGVVSMQSAQITRESRAMEGERGCGATHEDFAALIHNEEFAFCALEIDAV